MTLRPELEERVALAQERKASVEADATAYHHRLHLAADSNRTYWFKDPVVDGTVDNCIEVIEKWTSLSPEPIVIAFNSPGGSIFSGFALFDFLTEMAQTHAIETTVYGYAASMAGVLLQAGSWRTMRPNAHMMVHEASSMQQGSMAQLRDQMDLLEKMQERTVAILADRSGGKTSVGYIDERTSRKDWWLTAKEALEHGFIDEIVYPG